MNVNVSVDIANVPAHWNLSHLEHDLTYIINREWDHTDIRVTAIEAQPEERNHP